MYGKRIKQLREEIGMTRKELAEYIGITESAIYRYEVDQRTPKHNTLIKMAEALGVSPAMIMFDNEGAKMCDELVNKTVNHYVNNIYPLVEYVNKNRFKGKFNVKELFSNSNELADLAGLIDDIVANRLIHVANKNK